MEKTEVRQDAFNAAKMVYIVIHYELGNEEMLPGLCKRTRNYLEKKGPLNKTEKLLLDFFSGTIVKITPGTRGKDKVKAFMEFKKELEIVTSDPFEKKIMHYFDFIAWAESKIEQRPFAKTIKEGTR